jgi:hypothetical protein
MNDKDLHHLQERASKLAQTRAVEATVDYDSGDGFMTVKVKNSAGGTEKFISRSVKFQDREQAEKFIKNVIETR